MSRRALSLSEARRIALAAQGFDRPRPKRADARHVRRTIHQLGLLQVDYVNVLVPAHYQVLFSRLGSYDRALLDDLVYRRREFTEHWAHEASILPVESWPLVRHRMESYRIRPPMLEKLLKKHARYVDGLLDEIRDRGPLTADDLSDSDELPRRLSDKWGWSRALKRAVLDTHFGFGRLAVADRLPNFARVYDIAERVVPLKHYRRKVEREDAQRELLRLAARSHGVGTAGDLADYYRMPIREARPRLTELVSSGELREVEVESWGEPAYLHRDSRRPRAIDASTLLSPFDPVVWCRPRAARLFDFDYRIEIFVPSAKRKWGYYVLPFLLGDRIVARVDLKADREGRRLLVPAAYLERDAKPGPVAEALAAELQTMAGWLDLDEVAVGRRGGFALRLRKAVGR